MSTSCDTGRHGDPARPAPGPPASTVALMLADARLPSGGHVSSAGLEPALLGGLRPAEIAEFLELRARTVALVDAGTAVVARHLALRGGDLSAVESAWAARTPGAWARQVARELGRGLLRLATTLWPQSPALAPLVVLPRDRPPARPVVLGAIAAHAGLGAEELARLAVYDDTASAVAALLKLEPGDPAEASGLLLRACAAAETAIPELARSTSPDDIPVASAPQAEDWIEQHALTTRRLFRG